MQNLRLSLAQVRFHQICTLKVYKVSAKKGVEELCLMIPKSHSVYPPLSAGGLSLQPNFRKRGWLDGTSAFRGDLLGKRG